jgi:hypothetical protein
MVFVLVLQFMNIMMFKISPYIIELPMFGWVSCLRVPFIENNKKKNDEKSYFVFLLHLLSLYLLL